MKIAITGHTSGIGEAILDILTLTGGFDMPVISGGFEEDRLEIKCYSRSNGWNLAENNGALLLEELLDFNPDIFFNNAWHPGVQNTLCKKLHTKWKDQHKVIANTGSITAYVPHTILDENNVYAQDKKALAEYCVQQSFMYPYKNKCRLINFSWGFVETGIVSSGDKVSKEALIDAMGAAEIMISHAEDAWARKERWTQPEVIINSLYYDEDEQQRTFSSAARGVAKHLIKTKKLGN